MPTGDRVLVRSFPSDPLVRHIYYETASGVLVWRGTAQPDDVPSPCPKERVFIFDADLVSDLEHEIRASGPRSHRLSDLWAKAQSYYNCTQEAT